MYSFSYLEPVLPKKCTGHSKHPLPTTQEKTLYGHHQMVNTETGLIIFFAAKDREALMGIPDHLICLLRNLYAGQEATVSTGHGTTDWFQIGKGVLQGCILSRCLFNLYENYIMRNVRLDEAQAGIKIAGRNINNLRYGDDTTLMAESKEELKSLLMKVKEESEEADLKLNIQQTKIMASSPIIS